MACQQTSEDNQGTAIASTPEDAAKTAITRSILGGEIFCNLTGSCADHKRNVVTQLKAEVSTSPK